MKKPAIVKGIGLVFCFFFFAPFLSRAQSVKDSTTALFNFDTVAKNLGFPWEIFYGPDDSLWITEARGYRVVRISKNRTTAQKNVAPQQVLKIPLGSSEINFDRSVNRWPQGGMQGLAIHPEFMTNSSKRWVYLSYVYKQESCPGGSNASYPNGFPCIFRTKIVRCHFYFAADAGNPTSAPKRDTLTIIDTLISNLPGSNDHNSGRMVISPQPELDGTYKLYYTIGDMGAGQFNNDKRTNNAQNRDTVEGKILRLNTEPDGDGVPSTPIHNYDKYRQWIPNDNPFNHSVFTALETPIYSYGHRNAQGITWGSVGGTWRLYSSEHGDKSDDEVNIIQAGGNYGWPKVAGMADDNYNITDANSNNDYLANTQVTWREITWAATNSMKRPLFSFFNADSLAVPSGGTNIFTWPTIAPSGIDFYEGNIPGWKYSLLVTSLKYGMYRLKLNSSGTFVDSTAAVNAVDTFPLLHGWRVRDIALNPIANSGQFWVVIDSSGSTSGPTGGFNGVNTPTKDGGYVLRLTYKTAIILPLQFVTFTGRLMGNKVLLTWKADVDGKQGWFEIERSIDRQTFITIGKVPNGTYTFTDATPSIGTNYYRIKAVSNDGKTVYTNIINITYLPGYFTLNIYPNPVNNLLGLRMSPEKMGKVTVQVSDAGGRQLYSEDFAVTGLVKDVTIDVTTWPSQLYVVKIFGADNKIIATKKFVKQ